MGVDPEVIHATGRALSLFDHISLAMIIFLIISVALIIVLGPKWLDKRDALKRKDLNNKNQQLSVENDALMQEIAGRLAGIETIINELKHRMEALEKDKISLKMLARDVLRSNILNDKLPAINRLEDAKDFLKLGGDGNTMPTIKELALHNPAIWNHVLEEDSKRFVDEEMQEHYIKCLEEIKRHLL